MTWVIALIVKPFIAALFLMLVWWIKYMVWRFVPDGKIKAMLLRPIGHEQP
jgi:hypothetical protein